MLTHLEYGRHPRARQRRGSAEVETAFEDVHLDTHRAFIELPEHDAEGREPLLTEMVGLLTVVRLRFPPR